MFILIVSIILFSYFLELFLEYLNGKDLSTSLPPELEGIYDEEKYRTSQEYFKVKNRFGFVTSTFSTVLILVMLFAGGFALVDDFVRQYTTNPIFMGLLFFGIIFFARDVLNIPFDVYATFVIEAKFGFNKTTAKIFILDKIKGYLLITLIGGGLLSLIIWIYTNTGDNFWLLVWAVVTAFSVFIAMFYSSLIVPLFNKQTPLEAGSLKDAINKYAERAKFKLTNIFVIDGSKRSTKANAYFSGLGAKKRIVLYDTLLKDHTDEELVAVLAHEVGHNKKKHVLIGLLVGTLQTGLMLFILSLMLKLPSLSQALGVSAEHKSFHIGIIAFTILYSPLSLLISLVMNVVSRKNEFEADRFAKETADAEALILALKKLSVNNLSNLQPHPAYVFFHYSHPPLLERIKALKE